MISYLYNSIRPPTTSRRKLSIEGQKIFQKILLNLKITVKCLNFDILSIALKIKLKCKMIMYMKMDTNESFEKLWTFEIDIN